MPGPFLARPGTAYRVQGEPGHLMVLSFDDGWCGDGGTGIDPHALTAALARLMESDRADMRLMGTDEDGREQHYMLTRPGGRAALAVLVLLAPAGALQQATIFTALLPHQASP